MCAGSAAPGALEVRRWWRSVGGGGESVVLSGEGTGGVRVRVWVFVHLLCLCCKLMIMVLKLLYSCVI